MALRSVGLDSASFSPFLQELLLMIFQLAEDATFAMSQVHLTDLQAVVVDNDGDTRQEKARLTQ